MLKKVIDIITHELSMKPGSVKGSSRISDLDIDRKDLLTVVTDLEDEYDIIIDYSKLGEFETVSDLYTYVESKI